MDDTRRIGAFAAIALGVLGIAGPLYGSLAAGGLGGVVPDPAADLARVTANTVLLSGGGTIRALFGLSLIIVALALHELLRAAAPFKMAVATAAGVIGGALFIVIGIGRLGIYDVLAKLDATDHSAAVAAYAGLSVVTLLLVTAGFSMFGVFVLVSSAVAGQSRLMSRPLSYVGILFGFALIGAHVTGLSTTSLALNIVMGPLLTIWPVWLGISLFRGSPTSPPVVGATAAPA
jgi:hypothetical protein